MKASTLAAAASLAWAGAAAAQEVPATADQCLKMTFDLAQTAEERGLSDSEYKRLEDMLTTMEGQCDARQFPEASSSARSIQQRLADDR